MFTNKEKKLVLKRMIKMQMISDYQTNELSQSHVQILNTMFANRKKRLDCFNYREAERQNSKLSQATGNTTIEVRIYLDTQADGTLLAQLETMGSIAWSDLGDTIKR